MRVVVQAYGRRDIIDQALFSVLSLLRWNYPDEIWIYTDQGPRLRDYFAGIVNVKIREVTPEQIRAWRGAIDFVHRVKLEVLKDASRDCPVPLLYLDGDTVFLKDPRGLAARVSPGHHLMHVQESRMDQARDILTKKIARFCKRQTFDLKSGPLRIPLSTSMWNAGVIGLHPQHFGLWDQMIEFTDVAYALYQKHVIEQLAVSYFLQASGTVSASDEVVHHYWQTKEVWQKRIDEFLARHETAKASLAALDRFDWTLPTPPRKKTFWEKIFKK